MAANPAPTPAELFLSKFVGHITTGALGADDNAKMLLVDAFHDFNGLTIKPAPGGKSGATVWIVTPALDDRKRRYVPFLVKFNTIDKMRTERSRYEDPTQHVVPFRLHPRLDALRNKDDGKFGLLVFDFIDHALSFRSALRSYTPGQLIASLFDHTLGGCRIASKDLTDSLQSAFLRVGVPNWSKDLETAATLACSKKKGLPSFVEVRDIINGLPTVPFRTGTVHGDLHTGNLLVAGGSTDVLLIDFGSIQRDLPLALDPACLEVSIGFCPAEVAKELGRCLPSEDEKWLRENYEFPLDPADVEPHSVLEQQHIAEAVRAIRAEARKVETNPIPYALAVAGYLFRYASFDDNGPVECRALAYELGCNLVLDVQKRASKAP